MMEKKTRCNITETLNRIKLSRTILTPVVQPQPQPQLALPPPATSDSFSKTWHIHSVLIIPLIKRIFLVTQYMLSPACYLTVASPVALLIGRVTSNCPAHQGIRYAYASKEEKNYFYTKTTAHYSLIGCYLCHNWIMPSRIEFLKGIIQHQYTACPWPWRVMPLFSNKRIWGGRRTEVTECATVPPIKCNVIVV